MLTYNTQEKSLKMPEYGRNIQKMVDYCMTIEDRVERTRCARAIIDSMRILVPSQGSSEETDRKLWDHLAIMSDFKLDVDAPYDIVKPDQFGTKPDSISYREENFRFKHYGRNIERMIATALTIEDAEARHELTLLIANQMKKMMVSVNPEGADDARIFADLAMLSSGQLTLSTADTRLFDYIAPAQPSKKKKRK